MLSVGFDPFDVIVRLPLTAPAADGANLTVNEVLCPAFNVRGSVSPLKVNPVPVTDAAEIVRLVPPLFVKVSDWVLLLPTCTLPKAMLAGFGDNPPWVTPVPESGMLKVGLEPLEVIVRLPLTAPAADGANFTVNDVLCPAFSVRGRVSPLKLKPEPVAEAAEIVTLVPPLLVRVSDCVPLLPT